MASSGNTSVAAMFSPALALIIQESSGKDADRQGTEDLITAGGPAPVLEPVEVLKENGDFTMEECLGTDEMEESALDVSMEVLHLVLAGTPRKCGCGRPPHDLSTLPLSSAILPSASHCHARVQSIEDMSTCNQPLNHTEYRTRFQLDDVSITHSPPVPLCTFHQRLLDAHSFCPLCRTFVQSGAVSVCRGSDGKQRHFFHQECLHATMENWAKTECPHCDGLLEDARDGSILPIPLPHEEKKELGELIAFAPKKKAVSVPKSMKENGVVFTTKGLSSDEDILRMRKLIELLQGPREKVVKAVDKSLAELEQDDVLVNAVHDDDIISLAIFLAKHAPFTVKSPKLPLVNSAILESVRENRLLCIHLFHCANVSLDTPDDGGFSPIMEAVKENRFGIVRYLKKEAGCNLDRETEDGKHLILHLLESSSDHHLIFRLFDYGLATPHMIRLLQKDNSEIFVPKYILVHMQKFLPKAEPKWKSFVEAIKARDEAAACMLVLFHFAEIQARSYDEVERVCRPMSSVWSLVETKWAESQENYVVDPDVSGGKEIAPIPVIGQPNERSPAQTMRYISANVFAGDTKVSMAKDTVKRCSCGPVCQPGTCSCRLNSSRTYVDGKLGPKLADDSRNVVYECHELCQCGMKCGNRVVQNGIKVALEVRKSGTRGWGLFASSFIREGTFLTEYCGEVVSDHEASKREHGNVYLFEMTHSEQNPKTKDVYCVDAAQKANVGRFLNHSCNPSAVPVWLFHQLQDSRFPRIAFFAARNIRAGEELCFDYGKSFWKYKTTEFPCECGSYECRYRISSSVAPLAPVRHTVTSLGPASKPLGVKSIQAVSKTNGNASAPVQPVAKKTKRAADDK